MMEVLHLTSWLPEHDGDAAGTFVREHVRAAAQVSDSRLIHVRWGATGLDADFRLEDLTDQPVPAVRLRIPPGRLAPLSLLRGLAQANARLGGRRRPDVLHSHTLRTTVPAALVGATLRRPVVATEHWSALLPGRAGLTAHELRLARNAFRRCSAVLPVGPTLADAIRSMVPEASVTTVPNAIDTSLFEIGNRSASDEMNPTFLVVGQLTTLKRVDLAIRSLAVMCDTTTLSPRLVVVGDGIERLSLGRLAADLGVAERLQFVGARPKAEVAGLMRDATAVIVASQTETFSVVAAEALTCGVPVITTRCGGPEHFVDEDSGIVVDADDPGTLAEAMVQVVERNWDHGAIRRRAVERFSIEAVSSQLAAVYARVTTG